MIHAIGAIFDCIKGNTELRRFERALHDWKRVWWCPWTEYREVMVDLCGIIFFKQYRWKQKPVPPVVSLKPLEDIIAFDWLRDYGPLWEPDCTAFWLEPDTEAERRAWHRKYRPPFLSVTNDFDRATLGGYQHFKELTDAQMIKQMAIMQGTTPAYMAMQSQAYGGTNYQNPITQNAYQNQLDYLKRRNTLWDQLLGKGF